MMICGQRHFQRAQSWGYKFQHSPFKLQHVVKQAIAGCTFSVESLMSLIHSSIIHFNLQEDDVRSSGSSSPDSTGSVETSISSHFGGMNYPSLFSSRPTTYGSSQTSVKFLHTSLIVENFLSSKLSSHFIFAWLLSVTGKIRWNQTFLQFHLWGYWFSGKALLLLTYFRVLLTINILVRFLNIHFLSFLDQRRTSAVHISYQANVRVI